MLDALCIYAELLRRMLCHMRPGLNQPLFSIRARLKKLILEMNRLFIKNLCIASLLSAPTVAVMASDISSYGSLGTQGIGAGVSIPMTEASALRLELNGLNVSKNFSEDGSDYDGRLKNNSVAAMVDWHFLEGSSFRATAGLVFNDGGIQASGKSSAAGEYSVGGTTVSAGAGERVDVDADFRKISPYLGIGWSKTTKEKGFSFFGDIGAFYAKPEARLRLTPVLNTAVNAADPSAIERETDKIQDRFDKLKWYPVLRIGVRYTF